MSHTDDVTIAEAAGILGESRWTTQRRIRSGQLPARRLGRMYLLNRSDVEALKQRAS